VTLKEYFEKQDISPEEFSARTGISRASIYRYVNGSKPSRAIAMVIYAATKRKVTMEDLRGSV
jgi:transcriptional regulator with XRE-family HTH domain